MTDRYDASQLSRLSRKRERGSHDKMAVYEVLDSSLVCHIGYVVDGQAFATPTLFWRDGDTLYWHGSKDGRMIRAHSAGQRVCVTISHLDALNLGRSGIASSVQYRSVMAFGMTHPITDAAQKREQMCRLIDRQFPGRSGELRPIREHEIGGITVIRMPIEEATAKVKTGGVVERSEDDYDVATWAGVIPIVQTIGSAIPDQRLPEHRERADNVAAYDEGGRLDQVLSQNIETLTKPIDRKNER